METGTHTFNRRKLLAGFLALAAPASVLLIAPAEAQRTSRVRLGSKEVDGRLDRDTIEVRTRGRFRALEIRIRHGRARIHDVIVRFENGNRYRPLVRRGSFLQGYRRYVMDLPGNRRNVDEVTFRYSDLGGRRDAEVILYGIR